MAIYEPSGALQHLLTHFESRGMNSGHIEAMHPQIRTHYAKMAGLNAPTDEGWKTLIDTMRRREVSPTV